MRLRTTEQRGDDRERREKIALQPAVLPHRGWRLRLVPWQDLNFRALPASGRDSIYRVEEPTGIQWVSGFRIAPSLFGNDSPEGRCDAASTDYRSALIGAVCRDCCDRTGCRGHQFEWGCSFDSLNGGGRYAIALPSDNSEREHPAGEKPWPGQHGNGQVWTELWPDGVVLIPPEHVRPDGSLDMK